MKLSPFERYLQSLQFGRLRKGFVDKAAAYERLKMMTREDFGYDIEKWKAWGFAHPEIAGGEFDVRPEGDSRDPLEPAREDLGRAQSPPKRRE